LFFENKLYDFQNENFIKQIDFSFNSESNNIEESLKRTLDSILADEKVLKSFYEKDRDNLLNILKDSWNTLSENNIAQFQFHENARSFLRLHKPEKFGDDLSGFRKTIVQVEKNKKSVSGFEVGVQDLKLESRDLVLDMLDPFIMKIIMLGRLNWVLPLILLF
jgi:methyl-accepting chemotaxis protein